jgi:hypothetical protein
MREHFVDRMKGLAATKARSFDEMMLGTEVSVFGNTAVALAGCEFIENETEVSRGVEGLLLVQSDVMLPGRSRRRLGGSE